MANVAPNTLATNLVQKFNVSGNDNKMMARNHQLFTTRTVLGADESRNIIAAVKKLPIAKQKAVLSAIAARVDKHARSTVGSLYIQPAGQKLFEKLADKLGVLASFAGNPTPPMVMG